MKGWKVLRDSAMMRPGELMPRFMKRIGRAEHVMDPYPDPFRSTPRNQPVPRTYDLTYWSRNQ